MRKLTASLLLKEAVSLIVYTHTETKQYTYNIHQEKTKQSNKQKATTNKQTKTK